jgi:hypothetical protein
MAYLTTLNLNNFKMVGSLGLKLFHRGLLEWHHFATKFHEKSTSRFKGV